MFLARMGPNTNFNCSSNIGSHDIDQNYEWINDPKQRYSDMNLKDIDTFVNRNSRPNEKKEDLIIDYQTLNDIQKIIFKRIESHYQEVLAGHQAKPLRLIVMGTAGIGKIYLIKAIQSRLQEMKEARSKLPIIVLALTGIAAFNIDGITVHSGLSIPIINDSKRMDIKGEQLKQLQNRLKDVKYVIIDEKSMISRRMLALIDMRLRQAFPESNNELFSSRSIILFGDFGQILPVFDLPMYANTK